MRHLSHAILPTSLPTSGPTTTIPSIRPPFSNAHHFNHQPMVAAALRLPFPDMTGVKTCSRLSTVVTLLVAAGLYIHLTIHLAACRRKSLSLQQANTRHRYQLTAPAAPVNPPHRVPDPQSRTLVNAPITDAAQAEATQSNLPKTNVNQTNKPSRHTDRLARLTDDRELKNMLRDADTMMYFSDAAVVLMSVAKAGSSTTLTLLYTAATNNQWDRKTCGDIHNRASACWQPIAQPISSLPPDRQRDILTSDRILRVAIQRQPYDRLLSAYKSKYTCEAARFHTHVPNRDKIVPRLREQLQLPSAKSCMTVSEFAHVLDVARENVGRTDGFPTQFYYLDNHIRPTRYFFDRVDYDIVLDVADLSDERKMHAVLKRFPFAGNPLGKRFDSGDERLFVPKEAERSIRAFAALSEVATLKYIYDDVDGDDLVHR